MLRAFMQTAAGDPCGHAAPACSSAGRQEGGSLSADLWCVIGAQLPDTQPPVGAEAQQVVAHAQHRNHRLRVTPVHAGPAPQMGNTLAKTYTSLAGRK